MAQYLEIANYIKTQLESTISASGNIFIGDKFLKEDKDIVDSLSYDFPNDYTGIFAWFINRISNIDEISSYQGKHREHQVWRIVGIIQYSETTVKADEYIQKEVDKLLAHFRSIYSRSDSGTYFILRADDEDGTSICSARLEAPLRQTNFTTVMYGSFLVYRIELEIPVLVEVHYKE